jgi:hypothetical protein
VETTTLPLLFGWRGLCRSNVLLRCKQTWLPFPPRNLLLHYFVSVAAALWMVPRSVGFVPHFFRFLGVGDTAPVVVVLGVGSDTPTPVQAPSPSPQHVPLVQDRWNRVRSLSLSQTADPVPIRIGRGLRILLPPLLGAAAAAAAAASA